MPIDAYVERAASELRDAASELHDEIQELRREVYDEQVRLRHEASDVDYQSIVLKLDEDMASDVDRRNAVARQRDQLRHAAEAKRHEADRRGTALDNAIRAKTTLINQLTGIAAQLESLATSAR